MAAEPRDRVDVWLLRRPQKVADHHVFDHALAKRARRGHRGPPVMRGGGCDDHILSDGRLHLSPFPPAPKEQVRSIRRLNICAFSTVKSERISWPFWSSRKRVARGAGNGSISRELSQVRLGLNARRGPRPHAHVDGPQRDRFTLSASAATRFAAATLWHAS